MNVNVSPGIFDGEACVGEAVYSPYFNWVTSLVVARPYRRRGIGLARLCKLARRAPAEVASLTVFNVDGSDVATLRLLAAPGAVPCVDQHEMALSLILRYAPGSTGLLP